MKRKTEAEHIDPDAANGQPEAKKRALSSETITTRFRSGLFDEHVLNCYKKDYVDSEPYKHGVISNLINPSLLRSVRDEIQEHLSFTEKETDIYKIFQSGDLANLDGLDDGSLARLPSLLQLRDALYSAQFRRYLSEITGAGDLSGKKTDMAINVYTEGCHLLCHDDVIGSRRVSYILYLTDPDVPWKQSWGGALRLYPTKTEKDETGRELKIPSADFSVSIPPAFSQLSFFAVQPGESFHDVEEVYHPDRENGEEPKEKRVRMAISGWYHIPQEGEEGYEEGLEEKLAERSSLTQLQGRGDAFDRPQPQVVAYEDTQENEEESKGKGKQAAIAAEHDNELTAEDFDFLLKYIAPSYLTPDFIEEMSESFENESSLGLERIFSDKFAIKLKSYIEEQEKSELPRSSDNIEKQTDWKVSRPPHKHKYLYQQQRSGEQNSETKTPIQELLEDLLPSRPFKKWLSTVTGLENLTSHNLLARRFRRGLDYTLASGYDGEEARLEFTIGLTPTSGWEKEDDDGEEDDEQDEEGENGKDGEASTSSAMGQKSDTKEVTKPEGHEDPSVGGYEIYMAGDDDEDDDAAIYRAAATGVDGEDDGILFSMAAGWNKMSIVLRDRGTLKFVKYVSRAAQGDRWDITGEIGVRFDDDEEGEEEEE